MPWGNVLDNPTTLHFVSNFASGPVADRTLLWLLASHRHHPTDLFGADLCWPSCTRQIRESLLHWQVLERRCLQANPAHPPLPHSVHTQTHFSGDLAIAFPLGGG
jgi:hypothetical protein